MTQVTLRNGHIQNTTNFCREKCKSLFIDTDFKEVSLPFNYRHNFKGVYLLSKKSPRLKSNSTWSFSKGKSSTRRPFSAHVHCVYKTYFVLDKALKVNQVVL